MVNVSDKFILFIKKQIISKGLNPKEFVICFVTHDVKDGDEHKVSVEMVIVPLESFSESSQNKLPFNSFMLLKKCGCWFSSDGSSFFHLINKQITLDKKGNTIFKQAPATGVESANGFVGKCIAEYLNDEKLTKKEFAHNVKMSLYKLNKLLKGNCGALNLKDMVNISLEFQGKNKISGKYFVMIEKVIIK